MAKKRVVQLNNQYIKNENLKRRYQEERIRKNNRFMGWILIFMILLLILPTYKLINSYATLQRQKLKIIKLQKQYKTVTENAKQQKEIAKRLKDNSYIAKYARAKYYLSRDGEVIYSVPNLLPK